MIEPDKLTSVHSAESAEQWKGFRPVGRRSAFRWCAVVFTVLVALLGIRTSLRVTWAYWFNDPLQSVGLLLVPLAVVMILLAWRQRAWERRGSWWGLVPVAVAFAVSMFHDRIALYWSGGDRFVIQILPYTLPLLLFGVGFLLLIAGWRFCAIVWFPLLLLLLAKPVPYFFNSALDFPLQHLTANVARSFASAIGFAPKTPELLLMFAPDFGMFIAPGCDGIRGAITMFYLALVVGYFKQLKALAWILYSVGALLLGYLFNLIRICMLVLYYRAALNHPYWENVAKEADYVIGILLFSTAVVFFAKLILRGVGSQVRSENSKVPGTREDSSQQTILRCSALLAILIIASIASAYSSRAEAAIAVNPAINGERMPSQIGDYHLKKTWFEETGGTIANEDGLYESTVTGKQVILIVWLSHTEHNIHDSWYVRGADAQMRAWRQFASANGMVALDTGFYNLGNEDALLMSGACSPSTCWASQRQGGDTHFVFNAPDVNDLLHGGGRIVSMGIELQQPHVNSPNNEVAQAMTATAQEFLQSLNLNNISRRFQ